MAEGQISPMKIFNVISISVVLLLFIHVAFGKPSKLVGAEIAGDTYLGEVGKKSIQTLGKVKCGVESVGEKGENGQQPKSFKLVYSCGERSQILWDISKPERDDFSFDDPKFSILWAGEKDDDGQIDFEIDLSPKYTCTKQVLFLSSKSIGKDLVGVSGNSKTKCGE